ncbi:MAG: hypothetical protein MI923_29915 [Phycisphaerales bacterium]|nr:hypothetical protein [Phycisphaerales bacterium]
MYRRNYILAFLAFSISSVCANVALAALPDDQTIEYKIYDGTQVVFTVRIHLKAVSVDNGSVEWSVQKMVFYQQGSKTGDWEELNPTVDTPDGRWWVNHADTENPELEEFDMPPLMEGCATSLNSNVDDLDFSFEGQVYTEPPGGAPYTITVALDYLFHIVGKIDPEEEGEDEPAELDDPPGSGE